MKESICIIGGGPIGCALGATLSSLGFKVDVFERYPDIRFSAPPAGRSINLVLTNRGLRLSRELGTVQDLLEFTVQVNGRCIHSIDGTRTFQPYGMAGECNYSIDRSLLNKFWLTEAEKRGCQMFFDHEVITLSLEDRYVTFSHSDGASSRIDLSNYDVVFGSDGGGSILRRTMSEDGLIDASERLLNTGYKEVRFPAGSDGSYVMDPHALHIWARTSHMLMALANTDGSFTGTIFMDRQGENNLVPSLETVCASQAEAINLWEREYGDALELTDKEYTISNFVSSKEGILGTVRCSPWTAQSETGPLICLIGDAAHAIVPFFGQGVNCGFEDVLVLKQLIESLGDLKKAVDVFGKARKKDTDAIANLALENHDEMRSKVADSTFLFHKKVDAFIMSSFPKKYRTRYTLIMYSTNSYSACEEIGKTMSAFIHRVIQCFNLDQSSDLAEAIDLLELERMIDEDISPVAARIGVSFEF
jgi:kynurenine 3-monooxygenase